MSTGTYEDEEANSASTASLDWAEWDPEDIPVVDARRFKRDHGFWSEMPDRQWILEWAGWPRKRPRHSSRQQGWTLQVILSLFLGGAVAACLLLLPLH